MTPYQQGEAAAKADLRHGPSTATDCPYWAEAQFEQWLRWNEGYIATWERLKDSPTMERTNEAT